MCLEREPRRVSSGIEVLPLRTFVDRLWGVIPLGRAWPARHLIRSDSGLVPQTASPVDMNRGYDVRGRWERPADVAP